MTIVYRRLQFDPFLGVDVLAFPRLTWHRAEAWRFAKRIGGYARAHDVDAWGYTIEPQRAAERDRRYGRARETP